MIAAATQVEGKPRSVSLGKLGLAACTALAIGNVIGSGVFLLPALSTNPALSGLVAIGVVWLLTWVNLRGVQDAGRMQTITTILKLIPLVAVGTIGLLWTNWSNFAPTVPAGDVDNPSRTIPRATIIGTLIISAVYISARSA